jgi:hypothetical protein
VVRLVAPLLAIALLAASCSSSDTASTSAGRAAPSSVRDITNVLALRAAFNTDHGKPRLLLILSPT